MRIAGLPLPKWAVITAAVIATLLAVYAGAGFLAVPHLLRSELTGFVGSHYNRRLTLGDVRFNPFTLRLELTGISFPDADSRPMLGVERLTVVASLASIWRRGASLSQIQIQGPFVHAIVRADGSLNLADLAKPFAQPAPTPPPATAKSSAPARLFIDRFALIAGEASYQDSRPASAFAAELRPIDFELRDFATVGTGPGQFSLQCATVRGEHLSTQGTVLMQPLGLDGRIEISSLQVRTLWSAVRNAVHVEVASGVIGIAGQYHVAVSGDAPDVALTLSDVKVTDLGLKSPGAPADAVDLKQIDVQGAHLSLAQRSVAIDRVRLDGGDIRAWVNPDGTVNFAEWAGKSAQTPTNLRDHARNTPTVAAPAVPAPAAPAAPAASAAPAAPWSIAVPDIALSGINVSAEDRRLSPPAAFAVSSIGISVRGFRMPGEAMLDLSAHATVGQTGALKASASYALGSGAAHAKLTLANIDLTDIQPYLAQRSSLTLVSGKLGVDVTADRGADGKLGVTADIGVTKFRTVDSAFRQDLVRWQGLKFEGIRFRSQPTSLRIAQIVAEKPYARVIIFKDRRLNLAEAFSPKGATSSPVAASEATASKPPAERPAEPPAAPTQTAAAPSAVTPWPVSIGAVKIVDGAARYTDLWIQPNFTLDIRTLSGAITGLASSPGTHAKVDLNGKVDQYAPISISGELDPFAATRFTDLKMSFHGVELTTASPYSAYFAGYKIEKGTISADIDYHIVDGNLSANHRIVIDQLELGDHVSRPGGSSLPLKLAVALLKDRHGVIDLGLPVSGSLNDPQFRIGPIIWKVFVNLIVKAATAPFALIGNLFGGGGEETKYIDFDAGSAALDAPDGQRLAAIGKALADRPGLKLDVPSGYTAALDSEALRAQLVRQKLLDVARRELLAKKSSEEKVDPTLLENPAEHFRLLVAEYREELGAKTVLPEPAQTTEQAVSKRHRKKDAPTPDLDPAIAVLDAALTQRTEVHDSDLAALGQRRAAAVQKALLSGGQIDPARLFVLAPAATAPQGNRVRIELALH